MEKQRFIEAGKIINTHGIRGEVKIEVWLDTPQMLKSCGRVFVGYGKKEFRIVSAGIHKGFLIAALEGITDVNSAMSLKNKEIYIDRDDANLSQGTFFLSDVIGAEVVDDSGRKLGVITEIFESPAAPIYVIKGDKEHMVPAIPEFILSTDLENAVVTVRLLEGM